MIGSFGNLIEVVRHSCELGYQLQVGGGEPLFDGGISQGGADKIAYR
ncbi:hypothetical protein BN938_0445 [Mucinivorans hirudinis]|uniref:Uncharacterized protein n=1 Tax=Mucinivorans hirudinis TaxID=1433126 RepID=A0A060R6E5_9BACT|nr:hypothetical protein BN938_0445 [Mucinivorans hirudinis]